MIESIQFSTQVSYKRNSTNNALECQAALAQEVAAKKANDFIAGINPTTSKFVGYNLSKFDPSDKKDQKMFDSTVKLHVGLLQNALRLYSVYLMSESQFHNTTNTSTEAYTNHLLSKTPTFSKSQIKAGAVTKLQTIRPTLIEKDIQRRLELSDATARTYMLLGDLEFISFNTLLDIMHASSKTTVLYKN